MTELGIAQVTATPLPLPLPKATPVSQLVSASAVLPAESIPGYSAQDTDRRRADAVQALAQRAVAASYPLGDQQFTIFKDGSGQYVTRFTSLRDGKVTYIPEPKLAAALGHAGGYSPVVTIKA